jgi:hypothetical protein
MAALSCDPETGIYRIHFRYGGKQFQKSLKTTDDKKAEGMKAAVDETLHDLTRGRLVFPPNADFWTFVRSGGKLDTVPDLRKSIPLGSCLPSTTKSSLPGPRKKTHAGSRRSTPPT